MRLDVLPLSFACIAPMLCMCESTLPGMPWVGWALGEGLALARGWVGLARPPEPAAHHTLGTSAFRERARASESELEPRVRAALKQACPDLTSQQDLRDVSLSLAS